jgi:4-hydroxy-3-methylbut-2-enyl diphosphate reductase IspH
VVKVIELAHTRGYSLNIRMSIKTITLTTHFFCIGWKVKLAHTRGYCLNIRMSIKTITLTTHFFCIGWKAKLDISDMN